VSRLDLNTVRSEALFASALQRSDTPSPAEIRRAVMLTIHDLGSRGCAAHVAQEFGDHPDRAVVRMRWAHRMIEQAFRTGAPVARRPVARHPVRAGGSRRVRPAARRVRARRVVSVPGEIRQSAATRRASTR
jgi:hypothetical protein